MSEPAAAAPRDVWVLAELSGGEPTEASLELQIEARRVAQATGGAVVAFVAGEAADAVPRLAAHGAAIVIVGAPDPALDPELSVAAFAGAIHDLRPFLVLFPATALAEDLACRVSLAIGRRLARGCVSFETLGDGRLRATRVVREGRLHALETWDGCPYLATVPPGIIGHERPDPSRRAEIVRVPPPLPVRRGALEPLGVVPGDPRTLDLSEAEVIVAGGRGLGGPAGFELLQELADELGGTVGASRPAVDDRWVPFEKQIGQTGRTVKPRLYVACGISGAIQHLMGMRDSASVIVINKDPQAPIFQLATLGAEGDLYEILPALLSCLRERRSAARQHHRG